MIYRALAPFAVLCVALPSSAEAAVTYAREVAPIVDRHCTECHSLGADLNLSLFPFASVWTTDQDTIVARMIAKAAGTSPSMPPGFRPKLTAQEADVLRRWKTEGLKP